MKITRLQDQKITRLKVLMILSLMILSLATGCGGGVEPKHITQDEAQKIIASNPNAIILDVRDQEEYEKKHISNALLIPIDDLREGNFSKLPDKDATILVYCWTGRRAEKAAKILADKGYKDVSHFGGMVDWTGAAEGSDFATYKTISQDEAMKILADNPNAKLLDCRFPKDYEMRHIPNAIHFPLEAAVADNFEKIPDKDAPLITYCGDGNRGRLTAKVLVEKGYTNVYTMGGIIDWKGEVEGTEVNK